jgi:hypothetical protein
MYRYSSFADQTLQQDHKSNMEKTCHAPEKYPVLYNSSIVSLSGIYNETGVYCQFFSIKNSTRTRQKKTRFSIIALKTKY